MTKKIFIVLLFGLLLCGCNAPYRLQMARPLPLEKKDAANAEKNAQIFDNKQKSVLLLDTVSLEFALQYREYFAESIKMLGFKAVAVPFAESSDADIDNDRGREMLDFVMFLNSNSLDTLYLLRETHYINRRKPRRISWGSTNPYRKTLMNLKKFWQQLPYSAEMPSVIIAVEVNHWNDKNVDRPSGLLFTWRKEKNKKGDSNDRMFQESISLFKECRNILDLEQLVLLIDEELAAAGENGGLTGGRMAELLDVCDALAVDFSADGNKGDIAQRLKLMSSVSEQGSIFAVVSPEKNSVGGYAEWLGSLQNWYSASWKNKTCAGVWVQNWMKLNKIWRLEK